MDDSLGQPCGQSGLEWMPERACGVNDNRRALESSDFLDTFF